VTRRFSATVLLGLVLGYNGPSHLQRLDPGTLAPRGPALHLSGGLTGYAWARRDSTIALELRGPGMGNPIKIVDAQTLGLKGSIAVGPRDVCGLTFRGPWLVALVADDACFFTGAREEILKIDVAHRRIVSTTSVARTVRAIFPSNLAFGDGYAFATDASGVTSIDLRTGAVAHHAPRRALAKGNFVAARWLGGHLLGDGARLVDVRTWRSRTLLPGARSLVPAGSEIVAIGSNGAAVFTRSGRLVRRILAGEDTTYAWVVGSRLYALVGFSTDVVDLQTGRRVRAVAASKPPMLLEP
jgi:hypothetical protein